MALKPKVLLLDEPAAGVPQSDTGRIEKALADLPGDLAVLMIEHDMDLVFRFAKRVVVLAAGTIIFDGSPADVTKDARVREAYLGSYAQCRPRRLKWKICAPAMGRRGCWKMSRFPFPPARGLPCLAAMAWARRHCACNARRPDAPAMTAGIRLGRR